MTSTFNAIDYSNELDATGVPPGQAAVHVKALSNVMADVTFASDLVKVEGNLRQEVRNAEGRLEAKIEALRTELTAKIELVRAELIAKIELVHCELNGKIEATRAELVLHRWMFGLIITISSANLALTVRLLMP
ncbi:MAG: hypothetical protein V4484_01295 [Pseudomonadota bacterium]